MGRIAGKHSVILDDDTSWTLDTAEDDEDGVEYIMRYGTPEERESIRLVVAGMISDYHALIWSTQRRRNAVIGEIRRTIRLRTETARSPDGG